MSNERHEIRTTTGYQRTDSGERKVYAWRCSCGAQGRDDHPTEAAADRDGTDQPTVTFPDSGR